ncbi:uncharacterized protein LTR77_000821 [Saxophila tyrrhenica]|uniref:Uncharacterized protein n=1 Tax=Saxophila tyrrhenica TaxID=1690608 RepID=A0AAV9PPF5_9PEZI|nr:hypothetical protein LTR77_000821 [Saxophila tyrrhenica]
MLALMPQSPGISNFYAPSTSTMSLALLPSSPVTYDPSNVPTLLPPGPPASKRPKLSLNTSSVAPIFGKNATSLRLETIRNTFRNTHESQRRAGSNQIKPRLTPLSTSVQLSEPSPMNEQAASVEEESKDEPTPASSESTSSASTVETTPQEAPYKLPFNTTSILTNGPIPRTTGRRTSFSQTRPMFPTAKKVLFRAELTEEIETTKYTLKHSDIEAILPVETAKERDEEPKQNHEEEGAALKERTTMPRTGHKRDSSEDDSDTCPATPVAGRQKKHRRWRWTLEPVSPASPVKQKQEEDVGTAGDDGAAA